MRILGLDNSTKNVGYSIFNNGELEKYGLISLDKIIKNREDFLNKDYLERICLMKEILLEMIERFSIDVVGFEDTVLTSYGKNPQVDVFKKLNKALGVYEIALIEKQLTFETIPANIWREGLKLGTKREEIKTNTIVYVNENFGLALREYNPKSNDNDDDISDAIMIGKYISDKFKKLY